MKTRILVLLAFLLVSSEVYNFPITEINPVKSGIQEEATSTRAVKVLNTVYKKYASYASLAMDIDITIKDGNFSHKKTGKAFVKGNQYRLQTNEEDIVSNSETLWVYLKGSQSLQITNASTNDQNFFCYPAMLLQKYQKYCVVEFLKNNATEYVVQFSAHNNDCPYQKIIVHINKSNYNINKIEALETEDIGYTIKINNFRKNANLKNDTFIFNEKEVKPSKVRDFRK